MVERPNADCRVLCCHEKHWHKGSMLTLVCFVFRRKAGGGGDEDADCGVLHLRGHHHPLAHSGLPQDSRAGLLTFRSA